MYQRGNDEIEKKIIQELESLRQVLHLTHHRNKNQHRTLKWYKSFSQLRRQMAKLQQALETLVDIRSLCNHSDKARESVRVDTQYELTAHKQVVERGQFIRKFLVHRCYRSFSNLMADCQYAVLGLMLIGQLARVHSILERLLGPEEDEKDQEDNLEEQEQGDNLNEDVFTEKGHLRVDDSGEIISRQEFQARHIMSTDITDAAESSSNIKNNTINLQMINKKRETSEKSKASSASKSRRKKRKVKSDIFDEIFSGLL